MIAFRRTIIPMSENSETPSPDVVANRGIRLLIVDDNPVERLLLQTVLRQAGYSVETASDGAEALEKVLKGGFHIMVTDWEMPGLDGGALCRRVREADLPTYLYTLLLTSHGSEADVVAGLEAGADDYLRKPPSRPELLARLKAGARIVRLEQSLCEAREKVHKLSVTDALCGTFNRRYLDEQLGKEVERARRYQRPLSIVLADLDLFKLVNDKRGHQTGDEVIKYFAGLLLVSIRANDWVARYGGEEFVIVLPETDLAGAGAVAEKIRAECANATVSTSTGDLRITASFGVASLGPTPESPGAVSESLLRHVDAALYTSKRLGRNRVTLAKDGQAMSASG
jgi:two-component system cell cycle response regulator